MNRLKLTLALALLALSAQWAHHAAALNDGLRPQTAPEAITDSSTMTPAISIGTNARLWLPAVISGTASPHAQVHAHLIPVGQMASLGVFAEGHWVSTINTTVQNANFTAKGAAYAGGPSLTLTLNKSFRLTLDAFYQRSNFTTTGEATFGGPFHGVDTARFSSDTHMDLLGAGYLMEVALMPNLALRFGGRIYYKNGERLVNSPLAEDPWRYVYIPGLGYRTNNANFESAVKIDLGLAYRIPLKKQGL